MSDAAVYLCINSFLQDLQILQSVTVLVKTMNSTFAVQQSPVEDTDPGESVILNCTVQNMSCDGAHSVHWFKQSEESAAGVLYSSGGNSDQCERKTKKGPTNSCVYNLPIDNVSSGQTGTYYCAVAACGQVLFGDGTRIDIKDGVNELYIIYMMAGALLISSVLVLVLALSLCRMKKKYNRLSSELKRQRRASSVTNAAVQEPDEDSLYYAALNIQPSSRRHRVTAKTDCVYSGVQQD
ncbi:hypothetical protein WMY93_017276 [Mugilogobius chulae]|uniref:Ig-like domain-containing protein n=1 Tax=Mugilogobius chulae TaxID=88201 RepID=A0AAW0NZX5_9GOBI